MVDALGCIQLEEQCKLPFANGGYHSKGSKYIVNNEICCKYLVYSIPLGLSGCTIRDVKYNIYILRLLHINKIRWQKLNYEMITR